MSSVRFNVSAIHDALKEFQKAFPDINEQILMKREDVTDQMVDHIVKAYEFMNELLDRRIDIFTPAGLNSLLEINHIVLCGTDPDTRSQYYKHVMETRTRFLKRIRPIKAWVLKSFDDMDPWKLATGFYTRNLSQPQLFLEGNHRSGNILLNYLLISKRMPPYVVSVETSREYLDLSGDIKFTDKENSWDTTLKMPGHRKKFQNFLRKASSRDYLIGDLSA